MRNLKRALSLALATVMTMGLMMVGSGASYKDVKTSDNVEAIEVLQTVGIMTGDENGNFNPDKTVTRNEMAVIMANLLNLDYDYYRGTNPFTDVPSWAAPYVAACAAEGVVSGIGNNMYGGEGNVTAAQASLMIMKALGYFQYQADFGDDWQIATIRQASYINLFSGINANAETSLTRNQIAQLVLNGLKAKMVDFTGTVGTTATVGDATIHIGYKAEYTARTSADKKYNSIDDGKTNIGADDKYYVQLGEELYDGDLTLKSSSDEFERPANNWRYDGKDIGTYSKAPDLTYTAKVEAGDIYADLGLSKTVDKDNVSIYVNGVKDNSNAPSVMVKKGSDTAVGVSGNGVLTEVYYDDDNNSMIITQVLTYIGEVNKTVDATDKRDAYVVISTTISNNLTKPVGAAGTEEFETDQDFANADKVLYTFSEKEDEVISLASVESVTGTVSKVVNNKNDLNNSKVTISGTEYKASKALDSGVLSAISVDQDYTAYLDDYGYVIAVSEEEYTDYALVVAIEGASQAGFTSDRAKLLFTDGTLKTVELDKDYTTEGVAQNEIVTYKQNDNKTYTLKEVKLTQKVTNSATFNMANGIAKITTGGSGSDKDPVYGNSNSMFVVKNLTGNDYNAYTGIKNAPDVAAKDLSIGDAGIDDAKEQITAYWYCKSGDIVTAMFIVPGSDALVTDKNNDLLFLAGESVSNLIHDKDGDYYEYQAVVKGEVKTVKVDAGANNNKTYNGVNAWALNGLFSSYSVDKYGIITSLTTYTTSSSNDKFAGYGVGTDRNSADYTVIVKNGTDSVITSAANTGTWTVDDKALFFVIDEDGNIETGAYASVTKDDDNRAYFIVNNGAITYMFVEEYDAKSNAGGTVSITPAGSQTVTVGDKAVVLTASAAGTTKNDEIASYQWYSDNDNSATINSKTGAVTGATKIVGATKDTYTVATDKAAAQTYYFCVVEFYNDKADGQDVLYVKSNATDVTVNAKAAATMSVQVTYMLDDNKTVVESKAPQELTADSGKNYITVNASAPEGYKVVGLATQYVNFVENGFAQVTFTVERQTAGLTLPANVTAEWSADASKHIEAGTADASKTTQVPVGASVTLKVDSAAKYYVKYGDVYKKGNDSFTAFEMTTAPVTVSADKYYKVTLTTAVGTAASNLNGNTVTAACAELTGGSAFVKAGSLTITFTGVDGSSGTPSGDVKMMFTAVSGAASGTYSSATKILGNASAASAQSITGDTITISDDQAADIAIAYTTENG